jgi:hypothetical protein
VLQTNFSPFVVAPRPRFQILTGELHEVGEAAYQRATLEQLGEVVTKLISNCAQKSLFYGLAELELSASPVRDPITFRKNLLINHDFGESRCDRFLTTPH